jgi:tetratricopeptide (TPR) repeat protein
MPEAFLAEAALLPDTAFERRIGLLQRAVDEDPNNAAVLIMLSGQLRFVGRMNDDVDLARRAVRIDPVSPTARDSLITELTYAGQMDAALAELNKAEQLWPGASTVKSARYTINLRYGDPKEALRMIGTGDISTSDTPYVESFLRARIDPTPANVDRAIADARSWYARAPTTIYHLVQVLGTFGRNEEVFSILLNWSHPDKVSFVADGLFRPALANVHRDPRMIAVAKRLGFLDYWKKTGKWPDFCFEPDLPYDCKAEAAKLK